MKKKIIIDKKEYTMPSMSVDDYMEYLDLREEINSHQGYNKADVEAMMMFICKAYGNKFTVEDLKDREKGIDAAGIIMEFQFIDNGIANEIEKRVENIEKNFQEGK